MKTICFFNSNRAWGGGEKWHFTTAALFKELGHETFIVANQGSTIAQKAEASGLRVVKLRVGNLSFLNPFKLYSLARFFRQQKVDAIILNLPSDLKLAGIASRLAGVKRIIYRRGMPHPLRNTFLNRFLFSTVLTNIVVNSEEIGRSLEQGNSAWFPQEKLLLVYNGVDPSSPVLDAKELYHKKSGELMIGSAGRLTEQKGQKYLLELARDLKGRGVKFRLLIAGEGELKETLQEQINEWSLGEEVQLLGHVSDMSGFFNSLDVFVFTSLYEGSANTLIETLQHGLPTVAFDISSNPEIIQHGKNGFLARPFEVSELSEYVLRLSTDLALKERFIQEGQRLVREKFDSKENLKKLLKVIEEDFS